MKSKENTYIKGVTANHNLRKKIRIMCGIAGTVVEGNDANAANLRMIESLHHRGPDDQGFFYKQFGDTFVTLSNTRLAIIDLSAAGHQPMHDTNSGLVLVYNGEVFNYKVLRRELIDLGESFYSDTDSEVVLKSYKIWGIKCLQRFRGMFAIAIWDSNRGELFLARDRFGIKPLYFSFLSNGFVFASEIRALLASGLILPQLDSLGLEIFLANGFLVAPTTIIKNVQSILPGHYLIVDSTGKKKIFEQYHSLATKEEAKSSEKEYIDRLRETFDESIRMRLISDAPLGAFLSGGLDSSAIVASMAQAIKDVRSFSISFNEVDFDESYFSELVANRYKTEHINFKLTPQLFFDWLDDAIQALDQPSFDGINTYYVARLASERGLRVALSGLGADELFGGYPFFKQVRMLAQFGPLLNKAAGIFQNISMRNVYKLSGVWKILEYYSPFDHSAGSLDDRVKAYQAAQNIFPSHTRCHLRLESIQKSNNPLVVGLPHQFVTRVQAEIEDDDYNNAISKLAIRLFLSERCLRDTDSVTMAVSLEARAPMTDHIFVETCLRLSSNVRLEGMPNKHFEWRLFQPLLGSDFKLRQKQGFIFPFEEWLRTPTGISRVNSILLNEKDCEQAGLSPNTTKIILERFSSKEAMPWSRIWTLYVLVKWCINNNVVWGGL